MPTQPTIDDDGARHILSIAKRFDVAARIWQRGDGRDLRRCLGEDVAELFLNEYKVAALQVAVLERVLHIVAEIAARDGSTAVVLKGMAQHILGITPAGARSCGDVDLLVPHRAVEALSHHLCEAGFEQTGAFDEHHHHPAILRWSFGAVVEIHSHMPWVSLSGGEAVTADELFARGLVEQVPGFDPPISTPVEDLRVAHLIVHGVAQHAAQPYLYPFGRVLADITDLGWGPERWSEFVTVGGYRWIRGKVSTTEVTALFELASALRQQQLPDPSTDPPTPSAVMLRHLIAGSFDHEYRHSLDGNLLLTCKPDGLRTLLAFARLASRRWFISRERYERRVGRPFSWWRYGVFVAARPPRLILTVLQIGLRTLRYRLRQASFRPSA